MSMKKLFTLLSAGFILFMTSCDIGLGSSVDTQTPTLNIEQPVEGSVYTGDIAVSGVWGDDKGVTKIIANIKNLDTKVTKTLNANLLPDRKWDLTLYSSRSVDPSDTAIVLPDGKYTIEVFAYDASGHQVKDSRTFVIDSTPPVFVVSKPNSLNINDAAAYGRKVQITGSISDDNISNSSVMTVSIFDEAGEEIPLAKNQFSGFDTSDTAVTIAQYFMDMDAAEAADSVDIYENYKRIYGLDDDDGFGETKKFYAVVTVNDDAGNISEKSYIDSVLKDVTNGAINTTLEKFEIKNLLNGSYSGRLSESQQETALEILKGEGDWADDDKNTYRADSRKKLAFTINSKANPTYSLEYVWDKSKDEEGWSEILKSSNITFDVAAGLDNDQIRPDSIKVIIINKSGTVETEVATIDGTKIYQNDEPISGKTTTVASAKYKFKLDEVVDENNVSLIKSGQKYIIKITGEDQSGNDFIPLNDKTYGFKVQTTSSAPEISFVEPDTEGNYVTVKNGIYKKASDYAAGNNARIYFKVKDPDQSSMDFSYRIKIFDTVRGDGEFTISETDPTVVKDTEFLPELHNEHIVEVPVNAVLSDSVANYTVGIVVTADKGDNNTSRTYYFYLDNKAPELSFSNAEINNYVPGELMILTEEKTDCISKVEGETDSEGNQLYKYTVRGKWSDVEGSGTNCIEYKLKYYGIEIPGDNKVTPTSVQNEVMWTKEFKVDVGEKDGISIEFRALDNAGNATDWEKCENVVFDFSSPVVSLKENTQQLQSYYRKNSTAKLELTAHDSNGLEYIKVKLTKDGVPVSSLSASGATVTVNGTQLTDVDFAKAEGFRLERTLQDGIPVAVKSVPVTVQFTTDGTKDGNYTVEVFAKDIARRESKHYEGSTIIDGTIPVLAGTVNAGSSAINPAKFYGEQKQKISGSFTERQLDTVYYYVLKPNRAGSVPADLSLTHDGETSAFQSGNLFEFPSIQFDENVTVEGNSTANKLYIQAKDKAGNLSEKYEYIVNIDTSKPYLKGIYYKIADPTLQTPGGQLFVNGTSPVTIYGSYSDEQSGVGALKFYKRTNSSTLFDESQITVLYSTTEISGENSVSAIESASGFKAYSAISDKTAIRSWKAVLTPTKTVVGTDGPELYVSGENNAGITASEVSIFQSVQFDEQFPVLSNIKISNDTKEKNSYNKNDTWYVNNKIGKFTISGIATDNVGVTSVSLSIQCTGEPSKTYPETSVNSSTWSFSNINFSSWTTGAEATLKVTDKAGNTSETTLDIIFDSTAPRGVHAIDDKLKDLYFRLGDKDNDEVTASSTPAFSSTLDKDAGSKYSIDTYGNAETLTIRGNFEETGSGIQMIYYKLFYDDSTGTVKEPTAEELADFEQNYETSYTGYFAPLSHSEERRVFYTDKEGRIKFGEHNEAGTRLGNTDTRYTTIKSTFKTTISTLRPGANYLALVAVDNVGNAQLESVIVDDAVYSNYKLNLDNTVPKNINSGEAFKSNVYSNPSAGETFVVYGTAEDDDAGISSVVVKVKDEEITVTPSSAGKLTLIKEGTVTTALDPKGNTIYNIVKKNDLDEDVILAENISSEYAGKTFSNKYVWWLAEINPEVFANSNGNINVYATVADAAGRDGNKSTVSVATVSIDTKAPEITMTQIADADKLTSGIQVNKLIEVNATVEEVNGISSDNAVLYATTNSTLGRKTAAQISLSDIGTEYASSFVKIAESDSGISISFKDVNTELLPQQDIYVTASVKDKAGNTGFSAPQKITVDQNSDRPRIEFGNLKLKNTGGIMTASNYVWLKNSTVIRGTVTDDDGSVEEMQIKLASSSEWKDVEVDSGSWEFDLKDLYTGSEDEKAAQANGNQILNFRVRDSKQAAGTYFTSAAAAGLTNVYLSDGTKEGSTLLGTSSAQNTVLYLTVDTLLPEVNILGIWYSAKEGEAAAWNTASKFKLGGDTTSFKLKATATDANGISSVTGTITFGNLVINGQVTPYKDDGTEAGEEDEVSWYEILYDLSSSVETLRSYSGNQASVSVTGKDMAENSQSAPATISASYKKPVISVTGPVSNQYSSGNVTAYGTSDLATVSIAVSPSPVKGPGETVTAYLTENDEDNASGTAITLTPALSKVEDYTPITTAMAWTVTFDNNLDSEIGIHRPSFNKYLIDYGIAPRNSDPKSIDDIDENFETIIKLYLWIKAVDEYGNTQVTVHPVLVDPQGDRPTVKIDYPEANGTSLGGNITLRGSTDDPNGTVESIWIQVISRKNHLTTETGALTYDTVNEADINKDTKITNFAPTLNDVKFWINNKDKNKYTVWALSDSADPVELTLSNYASKNPANCYIKANHSAGSSSWNLNINYNKEYNPPTGTLNPVAYRVIAQDNDKKISRPVLQISKFDADTPVFSKFYLVQYSDNENGTGSIVASREYEDYMWVRGKWWLKGSVSDPDKINECLVDSQDFADGTETDVEFKYPLNTDTGVGLLNGKSGLYIEAMDATDNKATAILYINYDNTPPELLGANDSSYKISPVVINSSDFYRIEAKAKESASGENSSQSGLNHVAFYFMRRDLSKATEVDTVYNPTLKRSSSAAATVSASTKLLSAGTAADGEVVYDQGLYWIKKTVTRTKNSPNVLNFTTDSNIMTGGLVQFAGTIYFIDSRSDSSVTLSGIPLYDSEAETLSDESAYFALALVVDNDREEEGSGEKNDAGYYRTINRSDGDAIVENIKTDSSGYTWNAEIVAKNIPDGPIELHYVAFDKAGNYSIGIMGNMKEAAFRGNQNANTPDRAEYKRHHSAVSSGNITSNIVYVDEEKSYTNGTGSAISNDLYCKPAFVSNNAPRISKIVAVTDNNGDSNLANDEVITSETTYETYEKAVSEMTAGTTAKPFIKAVGDTRFMPEILGGNGKLRYNYTITKASASSAYYSETASLIPLTVTGNSGTEEVNNTEERNVVAHDGITVSTRKFLSPSSSNDATAIADGVQVFKFNIYDSTEGTTGTDSQFASFSVAVDVKLRDTVAPVNSLIPFFWKAKGDKAEDSSTVYLKEKNEYKAQGHIELESDLTFENSQFTGTSGLYDKDPKVSGKIRLAGIARDNKILSEINVTIPNYNSGNAVKLASYSSGNWTSSALSTVISQANYKEIMAAGIITELPEGKEETDLVNEFTSEYGHVVKWTAVFDTQSMNPAADDDVIIKAGAKDLGSPSLSAGIIVYTSKPSATVANNTTQTAAAAYTPRYRVDVVPYITEIKTELNAAYKNTPSVFNRSAIGEYPVRRGSDFTVVGFNLMKDDSTNPVLSIGTISSATKNTIEASLGTATTVRSGELNVTVNEMKTLNNMTNKTVEYNQEPNGINNDILTDSRKLKVWSFNTVVSDDGVRFPTMRVGKDSAQTVGFVYDTSNSVHMNKGTQASDIQIDYSFSQWYGTGVAVDKAGRTYGIGQNGDSGGTGQQGFSGDDVNDREHANGYFYAWSSASYPGTVSLKKNDGSYGNYYVSTTTNGRSAYAQGSKKVAIENLYNNVKLTPERIQNSKIVVDSGTAVNSSASVYLTYYDSATSQLKFRYGTVTGTESTNTGVTFTGALANHDNENNGTAAGYHIIAGTGASGTNSLDVAEEDDTPSDNSERSGEYVAIGVIPSTVKAGNGTAGTVVIAWYDSSAQRLLFTYNTNPTASTNASKRQWGTNTKLIDDDFAGWNVDMAVDPDGGIHIAYYGANNGDLKYAYMKNYSSTPVICTVDSYLSVGTNISIDVPAATEDIYLEDGITTVKRYIPRISYFMSAFTKTKFSVRTAYPYKLVNNGTEDVFSDGVESDKFTGTWEVMTVPTNQVPLDYTIGVGLKANNSGKNETILGYGTKTGLQTAALQ